MAAGLQWLTPFKKQCFVTVGVSLNMMAHGLVMGFTTVLLPQLKREDTIIAIDDSSGSWIASILGFALVLGNFIVPTIMGKFGRKVANLTSILPIILGWILIYIADNILLLLVARVLQGTSMGMSASLGPLLIGEYTSPRNRGAFLATISLAMATGVLTVHSMGPYLYWKTVALVCMTIAIVNLVIVLYSPESPSWLADQGKYEECRRVFRWLRGDTEEEELKRIIETNIIVRESKSDADISYTLTKRIRKGIVYFKTSIQKKEFYKPIFIMIHIYTLGQWAGANILASYAEDVFNEIVGKETIKNYLHYMIMTLDVQRLISNMCAIYVIRKIKRRTVLFVTGSINVFAFLSIAAYTYAKARDLLSFDHPIIGIVLIHIHMFSIATGTVPLPFIIPGELFPLEYRSLAGGISVLFLSTNLFITVKTAPGLFSSIGLYGAYCMYAAIVGYCIIIAGLFLPETKDRTLQDIEDEFRGRPLSPMELKSTQSLTFQNRDTRCTTPVV